MRRIGREPNSAEHALAMTLEDAELREHFARNAFADARGLRSGPAAEAWAALPESEREAWIAYTVAEFTTHARTWRPDGDEPPEPPTGGGEPMPVRRIA